MLPKRVLEFRESSPGVIVVRLRTRSHSRTKKKFAALSYCWGSHQKCITTKATLKDHRKDIAWSKIPQTFRDGIRFCLAIGIHHLWIDALCIVQDDPADWQVESARMADIYQNAEITLAATHSSSSSGGCFPEHYSLVAERNLLLPDEIPDLWQGIRFREKARHWTIPLPKSSSQSYPLLTRGWAFQERTLAPRVLHFCSDEMIWECNSVAICECGSLPQLPATDRARAMFDAIAERGVLTKLWKMKTGNLTRYPTKHSKKLDWRVQKDRSIASQWWHQVVEQYSSLLLSKETDRLPALSGIAARAKPHLGQYLAGLWSSTFASDLLWRAKQLEVGVGTTATPQGPSWSWASRGGAIRYWNDLLWVDGWLTQMLIFQSKSVKPAGRNPFGEVAPGSEIVIEGHLFPAIVQYVWRWISLPGRDRCKEHDPLNYLIDFGLELPLLADYVLSEEGSYHVPDCTAVRMLLVHPNVCLVLMPFEGVSALLPTYRRIGIVKESAALYEVSEYEGEGFEGRMLGSRKERIRIV